MGKFREYLRECELNESSIKVVADMAGQFGFSKDDIMYNTNQSKNFEKVTILSDDIGRLEKLGNTIKKATESKLFYWIIKTEDNYGKSTNGLYISNIENTAINKSRIIKVL